MTRPDVQRSIHGSKDKTELVASIKDAAHAGYAQGFQEGYQAACMVVEMVAEAWRKEPYAYETWTAL